jgi:hypothetical protein
MSRDPDLERRWWDERDAALEYERAPRWRVAFVGRRWYAYSKQDVQRVGPYLHALDAQAEVDRRNGKEASDGND